MSERTAETACETAPPAGRFTAAAAVRAAESRGETLDQVLDRNVAELLQELRQSGEIHGGPTPMDKKARSRFLAKLDEIIQSLKRQGAL